jgi:hypothetical protein
MNAPNLLALPVARRKCAVEHVEDAARRKTTVPPMTHACAPVRIAPTVVIANPISVSPLGVRPMPAHGERDRLEDLLDGAAGFVRDGHRLSPPRPGSRAHGPAKLTETLLAQAADRLAALAPRLRRLLRARRTTEMPRHERCDSPNVRDELRDGPHALLGQAGGRCAGGSRRP